MSWFNNTFLPSIFERAGCNNPIWLTQKQTSVCVQNMEKHVVRTAEFQGDYTTHFYYTTTWNGRHVRLQYSKLNGCGTIEFGLTEAEQIEAAAQRKAEKAAREAQLLELRRNDPVKRARYIERQSKHIAQLEVKLQDAKEELIWILDHLEEDPDTEAVSDHERWISEIAAELEQERGKLEYVTAAG